MQQQDPLEQHLYNLILELCTVLYVHGYREVPMGAMMRLIGVADQHASEHDGQVFELDQDFERTIQQKQQKFSVLDETVPPDVTLH